MMKWSDVTFHDVIAAVIVLIWLVISSLGAGFGFAVPSEVSNVGYAAFGYMFRGSIAIGQQVKDRADAIEANKAAGGSGTLI
jgi:hypothetical protein